MPGQFLYQQTVQCSITSSPALPSDCNLTTVTVAISANFSKPNTSSNLSCSQGLHFLQLIKVRAQLPQRLSSPPNFVVKISFASLYSGSHTPSPRVESRAIPVRLLRYLAIFKLVGSFDISTRLTKSLQYSSNVFFLPSKVGAFNALIDV